MVARRRSSRESEKPLRDAGSGQERHGEALASEDPLLSKEAAASIARHAPVFLGPHRFRPSAGWERDCESNLLEPFLWLVAEGEVTAVGEFVAKLHKKPSPVTLAPVEHTDEELHRRLNNLTVSPGDPLIDWKHCSHPRNAKTFGFRPDCRLKRRNGEGAARNGPHYKGVFVNNRKGLRVISLVKGLVVNYVNHDQNLTRARDHYCSSASAGFGEVMGWRAGRGGFQRI
jgi:hypothetical protein